MGSPAPSLRVACGGAVALICMLAAGSVGTDFSSCIACASMVGVCVGAIAVYAGSFMMSGVTCSGSSPQAAKIKHVHSMAHLLGMLLGLQFMLCSLALEIR